MQYKTENKSEKKENNVPFKKRVENTAVKALSKITNVKEKIKNFSDNKKLKKATARFNENYENNSLLNEKHSSQPKKTFMSKLSQLKPKNIHSIYFLFL